MGNFLKGKRMWGYVSGTSVKPRNTDESYVDAKIITWINNFIEYSIDT
jgi:hypothetical protein